MLGNSVGHLSVDDVMEWNGMNGKCGALLILIWDKLNKIDKAPMTRIGFFLLDKMSTNLTNIRFGNASIAMYVSRVKHFSATSLPLNVKMSSTKGFDENGYGYKKTTGAKPKRIG